MDKREAIERAFRDMAKHEMIDPYEVREFAAVVADQAIVIECEVEQGETDRFGKPYTTFVATGPHRYGALHCTDAITAPQGKPLQS